MANLKSARLPVVQLFIHGIEFYGYHGVPDAERTVGHRYLVDIEMEVRGDASVSDQIEDTVDYSAVGALVLEVGARAGVATLERIARIIGDTLLERFSMVSHATVTVAKPFPPMPVIAQQAGVTLTVERAR